MKQIILSAFALLMFTTGCQQEKGGEQSIDSNELMETIRFLADPDLQGRLSGSEGYNKAALYVAQSFKDLGLEDLGCNNFFQEFDLEYNEILHSSFYLKSPGQDSTHYQLGKDYICRGFSGSGDIEAHVVFCGYGISKPGSGYDDYEDVDVKGKIVVQFKSDPRWKVDGEYIGFHSLRKKASIAKEKGALGIIYVSKPNVRMPQKPIGSVMHGEGEHLIHFPQIHMSLATAQDFFQYSEYSLSQLQQRIDSTNKPHSVEIPVKAGMEVRANYEKEQPSMNVVGLLPGKHPELSEKYIVLGAHLDHVGEQAGTVYFPGANDNASGVASLMKVAEAMAKGERPDRSIIFVAFTAEESGLVGSQYFVNHSPVALDKIELMINMDCVAHGDSIVIGGGKSFPEIYQKAREEDKRMKGMVIDRTWRGGGADATAFYEQGIPTLYFATSNSYTHLHLPSDKPETINASLHQYLTWLVYKITGRFASGKEKLSDERDN